MLWSFSESSVGLAVKFRTETTDIKKILSGNYPSDELKTCNK